MRTSAVRSRLLTLTTVVVLVLAPAAAQADARSEARAKLIQGSDLLKRAQFEDALARFQEAYRVVPRPKIHYNFGLAYRGLGRKADALEAFERFLAEARDATKETRQNAERERAQLAGQITVLEVKTDLPGAEVFVDGRSYGTGRSSPIYLDPGPHQLTVEKPGEGPPFTERINATAGQRITIMAKMGTKTGRGPSAEPRPVAAAPPVATSPEPEPSGRPSDPPSPRHDPGPRWQPVVAWAAAGGAALALGFGTYELVASNSKYTDFNNHKDCGETRPLRGGPACTQLYNDASSARGLAIVGFAVGGALAATSVLFFLLTPDRAETETVAFTCVPSLVTPGVTCAARF